MQARGKIRERSRQGHNNVNATRLIIMMRSQLNFFLVVWFLFVIVFVSVIFLEVVNVVGNRI